MSVPQLPEPMTADPSARRGTTSAPVAAPAAAVTPAAAAPAPVSKAVILPAPAAASPAALTAVRHAVTGLVDTSFNWLNGLPANPIADVISGALLLVRRNLEQTVTTAPAAAVSNGQISQTFAVTTLADTGTGSLRDAITQANADPGTDEIIFSVAGVIRVGNSALPSITDAIIIDGSKAPGYVDSPSVRIDFQNTAGLTLAAGAVGSQIIGLSMVDAAGPGVTISTTGTILSGNYIGVWGDGRTVEANRGDGVAVTAGADGNVIGVGSTESFVLSNVISGNRGNGITIESDDNVVQANYIGSDASGTRAIANRGAGINITAGAAGNLIGGDAAGDNDPTQGVFQRPFQGNLISGNRGEGILIDDGATENTLSGNYIGTKARGDAPLGNRGDGVAIVDADYNQLVGTTSLQAPFVYYNVIGGNGGNGLRITNSDHTIIHASFFGTGADNATAVANRGDGILINGDSRFVDIGGQIPLGNVVSGNGRWGIEIADTAGGVVSFNSFVGQGAFRDRIPNQAGGILVTSSNPGFDINNTYTYNKIRTSLIGGNNGDGIVFRGNAFGAEVTDTAVGTTYNISEPLPNLGHGIVVAGNSSQIAIGGFQPSVEEADGRFSVHVGANEGWGIVFRGRAHDSTVFDTRVGIGIGPTIDTAKSLPNLRGGVLIGRGAAAIRIGGPREDVNPGLRYYNEFVGNNGDGMVVRFAADVRLLGNTFALNKGSGLVVSNAPGLQMGSALASTIVDRNGWAGLLARGYLDGATVQSATIVGNGTSGVRLAGARGISVGAVGPVDTNLIVDNGGWGVLASGLSFGSVLKPNTYANNGRGETRTWAAIGLKTS